MNKESINASLRTDRGCVRDHNEDFIAGHEPNSIAEESRDGWLYILADGVGGSDFGEVASQYATEQTIYHYLAAYDTVDWRKRLVEAIDAANADLRLMIAERGSGNRMATTLVAAVIHGQWATIANVGDSRGYHLKNGFLEQVTKDHSLVARLVEEGAITPAEADNHPRKNVILHSLGSESKPRIDVFDVNLSPGDTLILCSDGLTRHVSDDEMAEIVGSKTPDESTAELISLAKERGGEDNVSVIVLGYGGLEQTEKEISVVKKAYAADAATQAIPRVRERALWIYTAILCIIQTLLIFWTWILVNG